MALRMKTGTVILLAVCFALLVAGCGTPQIEGTERDAILEYAEPATDALIAGLESDDYAQFHQGMNAKMSEAMTEVQFAGIQAMLSSKVGAYVSRQVSSVEQQGGFITVLYDAKYENEEHVSIRVVFDEARQISGLWFDSPKLRK